MKHRTSITARGYELDSYGHVNNAVYLNYIEQARWELFRETGLLETLDRDGLFLVVIDVHIRYQREVKIFDQLEVVTHTRSQPPFLVFDQRLVSIATGLTAARATVKMIFVDQDRIPQDIPSSMEILWK